MNLSIRKLTVELLDDWLSYFDKDAFSDNQHWIFDEWPSDNTCINRIMKQEHVKTYYHHDAFCDLVPFVSRFQRYIFDHEVEDWTKENINSTVFVWQGGELYCCHKDKTGNIVRREMLYVHIRQRKMDITGYESKKAAMCIYPNKIRSFADVDEVNIKKVLQHTACRSLLQPDEIDRKMVLLRGYADAVKRRIQKLL